MLHMVETARSITLHSAAHATAGRYPRYVNPFIGMMQLSPDT